MGAWKGRDSSKRMVDHSHHHPHRKSFPMLIVQWPTKKLKYFIVAAALQNKRTGWIDHRANIQTLILFNYGFNIFCILFLLLPLRKSHNGLHAFLVGSLSFVLFVPYVQAMYDIFRTRILQCEGAATKYAERFERITIVTERQQFCGLAFLALQPYVVFVLLFALRILFK